MQWRILAPLAAAAVGIALVGVGVYLAFQTVKTFEPYWNGQGVMIAVYRPAPTAALGSLMALAGFVILLVAASVFNLTALSIIHRFQRYAAFLAMAGLPLMFIGVVLIVQVVHYVSAPPGMYPGAIEWSSTAPFSLVGYLVLAGGFGPSIASLWLSTFGSRAVREAHR